MNETALKTTEHQQKLLGQALGEVLVKLGVLRNVGLTGPELLNGAQAFCETEFSVERYATLVDIISDLAMERPMTQARAAELRSRARALLPERPTGEDGA